MLVLLAMRIQAVLPAMRIRVVLRMQKAVIVWMTVIHFVITMILLAIHVIAIHVMRVVCNYTWEEDLKCMHLIFHGK